MPNNMARSSEHVGPLLLNEAKIACLESELYAQEHLDAVKRYSEVMSSQGKKQEDECADEQDNETPRAILHVDIYGLTMV
jgi:hypothetical protein